MQSCCLDMPELVVDPCSLVTLLKQLSDSVSFWVDGKSLEHGELSTVQHLASLSTRAM